MFITPAYAESAGAAGGGDLLLNLAPFLLIFVVIYFLMIRPQQQKIKQHTAMVNAVRRGDEVVTAGGLVGKVIKAPEGEEIQVELAENVRVRVLRSTLSVVRSKNRPSEGE